MSQTTLCRLCVEACTDYVCLYNETGQQNDICKRMLKYFDSMFLCVEQVAESSVLCLDCCGHISVFYNFQQTVFQAQRRLREGERDIEFELKKKWSEERILNCEDNSHVTVKQDDSISLPDLELMEEFMFEDNLQNRDDQVNSQTAIEPIPLGERAEVEEDNDQSNDHPLSISDSLESEKGIRKQNADVPIPLCEDTEQFGNKIIINKLHTEQSQDQPLSAYDRSESEKGSDSDDNQSLMTIKRKLTRSQISVPKHLEAVRAQRKASLECEVCKKSLANFESLSEHFLLEHSNMCENELLILCASAIKIGNKNDRIVVKNIDNKLTDDQPFAASDPFESEKCSDSDYIEPTTRIKPKRKLTERSVSDEAVIAQWKPRLKCVVCKKPVPDIRSLRLHFRRVHPKERFRVECCGRKFYERSKLAKHARFHLNPDNMTQKPFPEDLDAVIAQWKTSLECVVCKKSVKNFQSLRLHFRHEHPTERYRVECCSRTFYVRTKLAGHARFHINPHKRTQIPKPEDLDAVIAQWKPSLECVVCKKSVTNFLSLRLHFRSEHPLERCRVECCSRNFYERWVLVKHARFHLKLDTQSLIPEDDNAVIAQWKPRLKCVVCKKPVTDIPSLRLHFRSEHPEERYRVECCNRKFYYRSKLAEHARFHLNPDKLTQRQIPEDLDAVIVQWKAYLECVVCKKSVKNFRSLILHFRLDHPKERCRVECCNRKFYLRSKLAEHARFHLNPDILTQRQIPEDLDAVIVQWRANLECVVCKKSVKNFRSLILHFRLDHPKERCRVECCNRKFYFRSKLAEHARFHINPDKLTQRQIPEDLDAVIAQWKTTLECVVCKKSVKNFRSLRVHFRLEHPKERCRVECCSRQLYFRWMVVKHARLHLNPVNQTQRPSPDDFEAVIAKWRPRLECPVCKKSVKNFRSLRVHFRLEHPEERCRVECCSRQLYFRWMVVKHARFHLNTDKRKQRPIPEDLDAVIAQWKPSLECVVCKKSVTNFLSLRLHFRSEHPKERCRVECCSRQLYFRWMVVKHARLHLNPDNQTQRPIPEDFDAVIAQWKASLECVVCKKSVTDFLSLRLHFRLEHPKELCRVECCSRKFFQRSELGKHAHLHLNSNQVKCLQCDSCFTTKRAMTVHLYTCKIANSKLRRKSSIECALCKTSCADFFLLRRHYLLEHPTEVCYASCCGRKFYENNVFEHHMRLHRDPNAFQCKKCGRRCTRPYTLKMHMLSCEKK